MNLSGIAAGRGRSWGMVLALLALGITLSCLPGLAQNPPEIDLRIVKYAGLKEAVLKNRGKVVLIDFWGNF